VTRCVDKKQKEKCHEKYARKRMNFLKTTPKGCF
jgi:hypothetical protein